MELTIKSTAFILNNSEDYVVQCLDEGRLKSLSFSDIIKYMNDDIDRRQECLIILTKRIFK